MMVCKANIPGQVVYYNQINQHQKPEIDRFHDDQTDILREAVGRKVQNPLESELQALLMALQHRWWLSDPKTIITEGDGKKAVEVLNRKMLLFERGISNCGRLSLKQFHSDGLRGRQTK